MTVGTGETEGMGMTFLIKAQQFKNISTEKEQMSKSDLIHLYVLANI